MSPSPPYMVRQQFEYSNRKENKSNVVAAEGAAICPTAHGSLVLPFGVSGVIAGKV